LHFILPIAPSFCTSRKERKVGYFAIVNVSKCFLNDFHSIDKLISKTKKKADSEDRICRRSMCSLTSAMIQALKKWAE
jgi:hypothetical protein